jgi:NADP-dependent 3-hydroxy acid dehydrogenase YdfG
MTTTDGSSSQPASAPADPEAVWLVTGCSSGFGQALAKALFAQGRRVVATARQIAALSFLPDKAPNVLKCVLDVTDPASISQALSATQARFGRLDVVINNAGGAGGRTDVPQTAQRYVRQLLVHGWHQLH